MIGVGGREGEGLGKLPTYTTRYISVLSNNS